MTSVWVQNLVFVQPPRLVLRIKSEGLPGGGEKGRKGREEGGKNDAGAEGAQPATLDSVPRSVTKTRSAVWAALALNLPVPPL